MNAHDVMRKLIRPNAVSLIFLLFSHAIIQHSSGLSLNNNSIHNHNNPKDDSSSSSRKRTIADVNTDNERQRPLTASQRERRAEETRRASRRNTATPGITSAIPNAVDFPLTPDQTEEELKLSSDELENAVRRYTDEGLDALKMLKVEEAHAKFQALYKLNPSAYCWQAGVVMFYLDMFREGSACFVANARLWEGKFGEAASEERIWRDACELKLRTMAGGSRGGSATIEDGELSSAPIPRFGAQIEDQDPGLRETRKVLRISRDLFSASRKGDLIKVALARAKLRSICGNVGSDGNAKISRIRETDAVMWRLSSWFYLGLHYDVTGDERQSKICMKMALHQCGSYGNGQDIIQALPMLHMSRKDWYDDDDFEEDDSMGDVTWGQLDYFVGKEHEDEIGDDGSKISKINQSSMEYLAESIDAGNNPDIVEMRSIMDSLDKMKLSELKHCVRERGMKITGSKSSVSRRLLRSMIQEGF